MPDNNQYSRMDETGQEAPQIVTPKEVPSCNTPAADADGVPADAEKARLHQQASEALAMETARGLNGDCPTRDQLAAQIDNLEAMRDRQMKAFGELLQGHISGLSCLSVALCSIGSIEAHAAQINDRLDVLFFQAGQITEAISLLRGVPYEAPYSFAQIKHTALQGEGVVVARIELRKPLGSL
jgi:hypothetical protein